jgi:hypothetical protein
MDIAKCNGHDCKTREECLRFTSKCSSYGQAWVDPEKRGEDCELYYPVKNKKVKLYYIHDNVNID